MTPPTVGRSVRVLAGAIALAVSCAQWALCVATGACHEPLLPAPFAFLFDFFLFSQVVGRQAMVRMDSEIGIVSREHALRAWFTREADPLLAQIDGLDIGWGGVQRWATAQIRLPAEGPHLDLACGYATFLAQLGWRFPQARLVGCNIDYEGPHALAKPLLTQAGVAAALVRSDARSMPFADGTYGSVSCFLGLQDIEIGFGEQGVRETLAEAVRVLRPGGLLVLLDDFPFARSDAVLDGLALTVAERVERSLDVRWTRPVAERAIALYAEGYAAQARLMDPAARQQVYDGAYVRMTAELECQLGEQGYYVPFGPVRMVVARKLGQPQAGG